MNVYTSLSRRLVALLLGVLIVGFGVVPSGAVRAPPRTGLTSGSSGGTAYGYDAPPQHGCERARCSSRRMHRVRVPGSYATYTKVVDDGRVTTDYYKTTVAPDGSIVHVKIKFP